MASSWPSWAEAAVPYAGALLVWTLALYVATRGESRRIPVLTTLAMVSLTIYLLGQALANFAADLETWVVWQARTWAGAAFGPGLWLLLTLALTAEDGDERLKPRLERLFWPAAGVILGIAALFSVVGSTTELVQRWSASLELAPPLSLGEQTVRHAPDGPLFGVFRAYALFCLICAAGILVGLWRISPTGTPLRARFGWLLASALLFILGVGELTIASSIYAVPGIPGHLALIIGMLVMGWNIARYGALLAGEVVTADFVAFSLAVLSIVGIYGALILVLAPPEYVWLERALPVLLVVMLTHVLIDTRGHLLDRVLYGPTLSTTRGQLRALANRVVRQPDAVTALADVRSSVDDMLRARQDELDECEPTTAPELNATARNSAAVQIEPILGAPAELRLLVEGALRHLNDLTALSRHPLLGFVPTSTASGATRLEAAVELRSELTQAIEQLRPPGARPTPGSASGPGGWLHYLVLYEAYVDGRPNKQIMQRYRLSEGTFHRARRRAVDTLTVDLAQRNARRQSSVTTDVLPRSHSQRG